MLIATLLVAAIDASARAQEATAAPKAAVSLLLGVLVTVAVVALGVGYWLWRRSRGPLHRADDDVKALGTGQRNRPDTDTVR